MVELEYFSVGSICFFNVWPVGISSSQLKAHHSERRWELQDFFWRIFTTTKSQGGETVKSENKEAGSEWSGLNYVLFLGLFWRKDFTVLSTFSSVKCCQTASLE
jgi:hypothetical protein